MNDIRKRVIARKFIAPLSAPSVFDRKRLNKQQVIFLGSVATQRIDIKKVGKSLSSVRAFRLALILFLALGFLTTELQLFYESKPYVMSASAKSLLPEPSKQHGELLKKNIEQQEYSFNESYTGSVNPESAMNSNGTPRINASFSMDPAKGVTVTDPASKVDLTLKPKFGLFEGRQEDNQLFYRLGKGSGYLVYTAQTAEVKEDIILQSFSKDRLVYDYEIGIDNGLEPKLEPNGSIGVYGSDLPINGNVSTGSEKDAELLQKAREKAPKNKLMFTIPAPVVKEKGRQESVVNSFFELDGKTLRLVSENLRKANYPLTIDPSVYVETARKFMRGNNESNIDFDTSNELIQKGVLTGARIPSWGDTLDVPYGETSDLGVVVTGGYIYAIGGYGGVYSSTNEVYWAKINDTTGAIEAPNPGAGACANWCNNTAYNLPAIRNRHSVVAYNGYLYVIGGCETVFNSCTKASTVYYAKIGANGEPISWSTTTAFSTAASDLTAVAYNNRMYKMGGQTAAASAGVNTVEYANINPNGTLSSWSTTGMTALPSVRWGHTSLQYNGYLYLVGGASTTTTQSSVHYIKINSDGSLASSWNATTSFSTARMGNGGNFATIYGGYMYINGGCSTTDSDFCSAIISNDPLQYASINADGTLTDFTSVAGVTRTLANFGFVGWKNRLYIVGGCDVLSTVSCNGDSGGVEGNSYFGTINEDGDVGPAESETTLPTRGNAAGEVGRTAQGTVIHNGYIYNIGGCANDGCTTMSDNTGYAPINADGSMGAWTVDSTDTLNGGTGLGAFGTTIYNNTVYLVGGSNGTAYEDSIFRATFNNNGTISAWTEQNTLLPANYGNLYALSRTQNSLEGYLYFIGGCTNGGSPVGVGCTAYRSDVRRCIISNATGAVSGCVTTNQLQLQTGVGISVGVYYANYIYMAGGASTSGGGQTDTVYFATIDSSGNIVRKDNGASTGGWDTTSSLTRVRRRGAGFGVNGFIYIVGGHDGTVGNVDTLSDITYAKIDQTTGELEAFTTSTVTITDRWNVGAAAANGYGYLVGGCTAGDPPGSCTNMAPGANQKVQIYNNYSGSPASFTSSANDFTTDRFAASSVIHNGYLYIAGGMVNGAGTDATNNVQYVQLNADGTIPNTWASTSANLGGDRAYGQLELVGGTLYYIGGQSDTSTDERSEVYYGTPSSSTGNVSSWTAASNGLPAARTQHSATVWNNRIYVTGGLDGAAAASTTVYASPSLSSGGNITSAWTTTGMTALPQSKYAHVATAYGSFLYVFAGFSGSNVTEVYYAPIASNGTVGSWTVGEKLPKPITGADGFGSNGFMYLMGGYDGATTSYTNDTYTAPINADGSLGYWSQTNVRFTTNRANATVSYSNGKAYIMGGVNGGGLTGAERTVFTTLQFQPHIANYSLAIDTDTNVFPTKWLANGLDNADGARWYLNYRSSTSAAASWGQNTNYGAVALGTPGNYVPLDGSGANTSFARYHFLSLTIDSQQAWGFPEDVTRGPTIADLSLFFTSDPAKRLIHGKTFIGGEQQPLDTPF
jgi:hypothetical protein